MKWKHWSKMGQFRKKNKLREKYEITAFRRSRSQMFYKIDVLKDFAKFTGKHLYWSLFLIKRDFIKKRLRHRCFSGNI